MNRVANKLYFTKDQEMVRRTVRDFVNKEINPNMDEWEVFPREAVAVGSKGIEQGVARIKRSAKERFKQAETIIKKARDEVQLLMKEGFIEDPDK